MARDRCPEREPVPPTALQALDSQTLFQLMMARVFLSVPATQRSPHPPSGSALPRASRLLWLESFISVPQTTCILHVYSQPAQFDDEDPLERIGRGDHGCA